jgi:hypothetical protein
VVEIPHLAKEARCGAPTVVIVIASCIGPFVGRPALGRRSSLPQDDRGDASQIRSDAVYISVLESFGLELS